MNLNPKEEGIVTRSDGDLHKSIPDHTLLNTNRKITDPNQTQRSFLHHGASGTKFPLPGHRRDFASLANDSAYTCPQHCRDMLCSCHTRQNLSDRTPLKAQESYSREPTLFPNDC